MEFGKVQRVARQFELEVILSRPAGHWYTVCGVKIPFIAIIFNKKITNICTEKDNGVLGTFLQFKTNLWAW